MPDNSYAIQAQFDGKQDILVITLGISRENGEHITSAQKDAAMDAAKSVLQIVGAEVEANSTAILLPVEIREGDAVNVTASVTAAIVDGAGTISESEEPEEQEEQEGTGNE